MSASPLYRRVLGASFDALPLPVRELHARSTDRRWCGQADVRRGDGWLARWICGWFGFPPSGQDVPVSVTLSPEGDAERWTRRFAGREFGSLQACGCGRNAGLLIETFGSVSVALALVVDGARLRLVPRRWYWFGVSMPRALLPHGDTYESEEAGRFHFHVEIRAPVVGLIVAYAGWLAPASDADGANPVGGSDSTARENLDPSARSVQP